jgi:hypothetical protein
MFDKSKKQGYGRSEFVHHSMLYSTDSQFVKNDVIFLCARIVQGDALPKQSTEVNRNIWSPYKEEFTLIVSDKKIKVKF